MQSDCKSDWAGSHTFRTFAGMKEQERPPPTSQIHKFTNSRKWFFWKWISNLYIILIIYKSQNFNEKKLIRENVKLWSCDIRNYWIRFKNLFINHLCQKKPRRLEVLRASTTMKCRFFLRCKSDRDNAKTSPFLSVFPIENVDFLHLECVNYHRFVVINHR